VQGGPKDVAPEAQVRLSLAKSSVFTTEPMIIAKQGKNIRGLPPLRVDRARDNLFVALEDKPLIVTEYPDLADATLRMFVEWKGGSDAYSGFERLLENEISSYRLDPPQWKDAFYRDTELRFLKAGFELPPAPRQLWLVAPDAFRPKAEFRADLLPYGAVLDDSLLPSLERKVKTEK
jgi:hypothetical protein